MNKSINRIFNFCQDKYSNKILAESEKGNNLPEKEHRWKVENTLKRPKEVPLMTNLGTPIV
ncbi:MAG: hypothetical protein ACMUIU_09790 [bacterium]